MGEYYLWCNDEMINSDIMFDGINDVKGKYISYKNSLCNKIGSPKVFCFWEGDLEIKLILNGKEIIINDHD